MFHMMMTRKMSMFFILMACAGARAIPAHALLLEGPQQVYAAYPMPQYHEGRYSYAPVVSRPIAVLPPGAVTIIVGGVTYYYADGIFYQMNAREQKYAVVPPPVGAVVYTIPQGYQLMMIDGASFYEYAGVYYKRVTEGYRVIEPVVVNGAVQIIVQ